MRKTISFAKGVGTGMAVGIAAVTLGTAIMKKSKPMKKTRKKMGNMLDTVSCVCENLSCIIK